MPPSTDPATPISDLAQYIKTRIEHLSEDRKGRDEAWNAIRDNVRAIAAKQWKAGEGEGWRSKSVINITKQKIMTGYAIVIDVLLQRGRDDLFDRAVMTEMNDLGTLGHQDPAHDVDRGVMAVEQGGRSHEAHLVDGRIGSEVLRYRQVGHGEISGK